MLCNGGEATIGECTTTTYSVQQGKDLLVRVDVAGITCLIPSDYGIPPTGGSECQKGATRLTGGEGLSEGNLEYCYNGSWSPTCMLSEIYAAIACKEFGFMNYSCECDNDIVCIHCTWGIYIFIYTMMKPYFKANYLGMFLPHSLWLVYFLLMYDIPLCMHHS